MATREPKPTKWMPEWEEKKKTSPDCAHREEVSFRVPSVSSSPDSDNDFVDGSDSVDVRA